MKLEQVPLSEIHLSTFNPPTRTTVSALRGLKAEIESVGLQAPIHVIPLRVKGGNVYALVDGHRRVSIALELKWKTIDAIVHGVSDDAVTLWATLNGKTRTVNAFEWMVAWHLTGSKMKLPAGVQSHVTQCLRVFGRDGIPFLIEHNASPTIAQSVEQLVSALDRKGLLEDLKKKEIGSWMVRHKLGRQVQKVVLMADTKRTLSKVVTRIRADQPFEAIEISTEIPRKTA